MKTKALIAAVSLLLLGYAAPASATPAEGVGPKTACGDKSPDGKKKKKAVLGSAPTLQPLCGEDGNKKKKKKKGNS